MAILDVVCHQWVATLATYNFQLYYKAGKTNIDTDALLRVSWPGCLPDTLDTHLCITAVAMQAMQEAALKDPMSPIKVYSCDLCILDSADDSPQVAHWCQAQQTDLVLGLVFVRLQDGNLGQCQLKLTNPPEL